jgi:adenylylsulfate kinase
MLLIQLTGLSGSGKTSLSQILKNRLLYAGYKVEIIDGDEYRQNLCSDLGYSKQDRQTNIRRLGFVGKVLARNGIIAILAAINPYEEVRKELANNDTNVKTIWINCEIETLLKRDTKGLYKKALLPDGHPEKIYNLTGINDPFESPLNPDLIINTHIETLEQSSERFYQFVLYELNHNPS